MEKIIESQIIDIINNKLSPSVLNLINESFMHNVPPGSESHFKLIVVSDVFKDLTNVKRHQLIYRTLNKIMDEIHALSIYAFDENEYNPKLLFLICFLTVSFQISFNLLSIINRPYYLLCQMRFFLLL